MEYKIFIISVSFLLLSFASKAQDRIITTNNDTLHCKILEISDNYILYIDYGQEKSKIINAQRVAGYMRSPTNTTTAKAAKPKIDYGNRKRWRVGTQIGGAYLLGSTSHTEMQLITIGIFPHEAKDFMKKYRHGINFAVDGHYMFNDYIGLGLKYSLFHTSAKLYVNRMRYGYWYHYAYFEMKENSYVNYIAPSLVFRGWLDKKRRFSMSGSISAGYANLREISYIENSSGYSQDILAVSHTFNNKNTFPLAINLELSFEYYILRCFSLGAQVGFFYAMFDTVTFSGTDIPSETQTVGGINRNIQARFDYALVARLHF